MLIAATYCCAFCGEPVETTIDASGGRTQQYVEDCVVCCRPNTLRIQADPEDGTAWVESSFEE